MALISKTMFQSSFGPCLAVGLVLLAGLGGCRSGGGDPGAQVSDGQRPVQLARGERGDASSALRSIDETAVRRAVKRYGINKKRAVGPYRLAGADLDADGRPEAVVLFEGADWCARTGCSLAVFKQGEQGFRPSFRTVRVRPPVRVARTSSNGWRDLIVSTGGGPAPVRRVQLRFATSGYPRNAMLEPDASTGADDRSEVLIAETTAGAEGAPQGSVPSNR